MNQLSWLLYLADVAGSVGWVVNAVLIISVVVVALALVAVPCSEGEVLADENRPKWLKVLQTFAATAVITFLVTALVPSKETVYAIAASELGESVLTSPTGQKATRALEAWLDRQIASKPA